MLRASERAREFAAEISAAVIAIPILGNTAEELGI